MGVVDENNRTIIPQKYDFILPLDDAILFIVKSKSGYGVCNEAGRIIVQDIWKSVDATIIGVTVTNHEGLKEYIGVDGKEMLSPVWKDLEINDLFKIAVFIQPETFIVKATSVDGKVTYGMYDYYYETILQQVWENIEPAIVEELVNFPLVKVTSKNGIGAYSLEGECIVEDIYDEVEVEPEVIIVKKRWTLGCL